MSDLISRQDAIDAFWKLDVELRPSAMDAVVDMLKSVPSASTELSNNSPKLDNENGELISRQDAIDAINAYLGLSAVSRTIQNMMSIQEILEKLPSAEPKITHCKDCRNRGGDECPMRHVEWIEWEEDGYIEVDDIVHDYTEPHGYCDKGERNERIDL